MLKLHMDNVRLLREHMADRRRVQLPDGQTGEIIRIETSFPANTTTVSVYTGVGPGIVKVDADAVAGLNPALAEPKIA